MGRDLDQLTEALNGVIARRVKAQRERLGMSLATLAETSGVALSILESIERRRNGCSAVDLWRISLALNILITELCEPLRTPPIQALQRVMSQDRWSRAGRHEATEAVPTQVH